MGQRSEIYIRISDNYDENPKLYAKYFNWNYGERMISRAKYGIEYIKANLEYIANNAVKEKINKIFDVNFDMKDIMLTSDVIREWIEEFSEYYEQPNKYIFECVANNDGKLFVDVNSNGEIKYCFTDYDLHILTPTKYMNWDFQDWQNKQYLMEDEIETCKSNIKYITENAKMMTKEELKEFINFDYSKQISELAKELGVEIEIENLKNQNTQQQEKEDTDYEY